MDTSIEHQWIHMAMLGFVLIAVLFSWLNTTMASPAISITGRWARWVAIAWVGGGFAFLSFDSGYPLWVLITVSFLFWFILETAYNYLAINALSHSGMPLFPRFKVNTKGDEWPSNPKAIRLKDWLRRENFEKGQALIGFLGEQMMMRVSVYDSADKLSRIHVLFIPHHRGNVAISFSITSITAKGERIITDNIFFPFGGFYPDSWEVERRPLLRSIDRLRQRHMARVDARGETLEVIDEDPLTLLNHDQHKIEKVNRELGFLQQTSAEEEEGQITPAGRYRVWQEIWLLSYLGKALKY